MTTMREAAQFFDLHTRQLREEEKLDKTVSTKARGLIARAAKIKARRPGHPLRIPFNLDKDDQRKTLIAIAQDLHRNHDKPSVDLHKRVMKVLQEPKITHEHMAELKVLVNEFRSFMTDTEKGQLTRPWRLRDRSIWGDVADGLEEIKDNKHEELSKTARDSFIDGLANFLGPAGILVKLGVDFKREYGSDAQTYWDKLKRWSGYEKKLADAQRDDRQRTSTRFGKLFARLVHSIGRFASRLKDVFGYGWSMLGKAGAFLKRNPKLALGALLGVGAAGLGAVMMGGDAAQPKTESKEEEVQSVPPEASVKVPTRTETQRAQKPEKEKRVSTQEIADKLKPVTKQVASLFTGLSSWVGGKWAGFCGQTRRAIDSVNKQLEMSQLKIKMVKDDIEEARDQVWDSIKDQFASAWEAIKKFIPQSVRRAVIRAKDTVVNTFNRVEQVVRDKTGLGGDGTEKPQQVPMQRLNPKDGASHIIKSGSVDMQGLNPTMRDNLYAMAAEYNQQTGKKIKVNSAKRSTEHQRALYAANPRGAAKPGYSMHEYGLAVDITDADGTATKLDRMGLLSKYGFVRPLVNASFPEPWHVEPIAVQGIKSAIRRGKAEIEAQTITAGGTPDKKVETEGAANTVAATGEDKAVQTSLTEHHKKQMTETTDAQVTQIPQPLMDKTSPSVAETQVKELRNTGNNLPEAVQKQAPVASTNAQSLAKSIAPQVESNVLDQINSRNSSAMLSQTFDLRSNVNTINNEQPQQQRIISPTSVRTEETPQAAQVMDQAPAFTMLPAQRSTASGEQFLAQAPSSTMNNHLVESTQSMILSGVQMLQHRVQERVQQLKQEIYHVQKPIQDAVSKTTAFGQDAGAEIQEKLQLPTVSLPSLTVPQVPGVEQLSHKANSVLNQVMSPVQQVQSRVQQKLQNVVGQVQQKPNQIFERITQPIQNVIQHITRPNTQPATEAAQQSIARVFNVFKTKKEDSQADLARVTSQGSRVPSVKSMLDIIPQSVAPAAESYQQVPSVSDVFETDVEVPEPVNELTSELSMNHTTVDSVPIYLGDLGYLMLNFGMVGK